MKKTFLLLSTLFLLLSAGAQDLSQYEKKEFARGGDTLRYRALRGQGASPRYTEYPGVGHNSWDNVFVENDLLHWLFSNKKN